MLSKKLLRAFVLLLLCLPATLIAQVTTSSIKGFVKMSDGKPLEGVSITATHIPSGTVYSTVSRKSGEYTLPNVRIGGPYKIEFKYVGLRPETVEDFYLNLGEPYIANVSMQDISNNLSEVVVTSQARRINTDRTGASTQISQRQLSTLPTIGRSITDFTRITPQANGTSFAGRDGRYNNVVIDGANLNNNFGLSSDPLPGGGSQPISLDAIEEVSVNIAPFDVRQSGFTGADIFAVTKSGTNTFHGSAYGLYRNQDYNGKKVGSVTLTDPAPSTKKIYGFTLGGPIIKNKLFFFANYEHEENTSPGITFSPTGGSGIGNISQTPIDSLKKFADYLKSQYNYDPGAYDNFPNFVTANHKLLIKVDWNINKVHKLSVKYNELIGTDMNPLNGTSIPNAAPFSVVGGSGQISRLPNNRFSLRSMAFSNSNYGFKHLVKSGAFELNSNFNSRFSNQFIATITKIQDTRTIPGGQAFPTIDIFNNNGQNYMSAGTDPFTRNNDVINDIYNATDNFTYYAGKHTLTFGATYEYQRVGNMFMPGSSSYYAFNSLSDFMNNRAPAFFSYNFSLVPGTPAVYSADLKIGQLGLYAQDEFNVNDKLKITYGLRIDKPVYPQQPLENPNITALTFPDKNGNPTHYSTGKWPKSTLYFSPRVGFRYKIDEENIVFRGGTGLFTGRIPFVFLTNMPSNSFMYQSGQAVNNAAQLQNFLFNPNPDAYASKFNPTPGTLPNNANIVLIDPNFKFPQVWRSNLAFDKKIGKGWLITTEFLYTKDVNAVVMRNANLKNPDGTINGIDYRGRFSSPAARNVYSNINTAIVLENTSMGSSGSATFQIQKSAAKGFYGSFAYTASFASEVTANPGAQATSVWNSNATTGTPNTLQLATSSYVTPHRFIGTLSYRWEYLNHLATTVSIFGQLAKQNNYSYVYGGDINNDGLSGIDLMYIPKDPSQVIFVQSGSSFTPAQQAAAFQQFIQNTPYLNNNKGKDAERNAAYLPWLSTFDVRILQDFYAKVGDRKHTLQLSVDILNAGNLINKMWGVRQITTTTQPLIFRGLDSQGRPTFNMQTLNGQLITKPWQNSLSTLSTWGMQLGLKYFF